MNGYNFEYYQRAAQNVAAITGNVLTQRPGTDAGCVRQWLLTRTHQGDVWLFAELDDQRIPKFEPYQAATHHLSSSLKGIPVLVSNHTGLRLAFLLSPVRRLPGRVELPSELRSGSLIIGQTANGRLAGGEWDRLGHMMVAGMTGSGKSYTLRSIVYQAMRQGFGLILGDLDNNTFPMLAGHPALLAPLAADEAGFIGGLQAAFAEIETRRELFTRCGAYPETVEEYNAHALKNGAQPLQRVLVALDEFNSAVENTRGVNGSLALLARQVAWRGRKFGVTLVLGSQDFSKDLIGKVRDQVGVMIVHKVKSAEVAQNIGLAAAARISPNRPGRAVTDRWGLIQAFYLDKAKLAGGGQAAELIGADERKIAERALGETGGKISLEVLTGFGMGQGAARRLQDDWKLRGWAENDPARKNGLYITPKLPNFPTNLQALQTPTNSLQTLQTDLQTACKLTNSPTNSPERQND